MKNAYRDRRMLPSVEAILRDVRYSARFIRRSPGFALMALSTLAIGIGATTAVFSLVNRALFQPLPVERPNEIVSLSNGGSRGMLNLFSYPNYEDLRDRADVFDALVAYASRRSPRAPTASTSGSGRTRLGQLLRRARRAACDRADDLAGRRCAARRVAGGRDQLPLLAAALRRRRRRDRPSGRRQRPDLHHHRRGAARLLRHRGRRGPGLLVSPRDAAGHRERLAVDDRRADTVFVLGRLRAGVGRPQASAALDGVAAGLSREFPDVNEAMRVVLSPRDSSAA